MSQTVNINGFGRVNFPDSFTPEQIQGAIERDIMPEVKTTQSEPQGSDMGEITSGVQGFNEVVPFGNRITAGMGAVMAAPFSEESIPDLYEQARKNQAVTEEQNPNAHLTGSLLGLGVTLPVAIGGAAKVPLIGGFKAPKFIQEGANAASKGAQAIGNFVRGAEVANTASKGARAANLAGQMLRGAAVSAPSAATYAYGDTQNDLLSKEAGTDALQAGGVGAAFGGASVLAGNLLGKGVNKLADYLAKNSDTGNIVVSKLPTDLQKVYTRLEADYPNPDELKSVLNTYAKKQGQALLEVGGRKTANLAEGAAMYPSGGAKADEFFSDAISYAPDKLKGAAAKTISPSQNYLDDIDEIVRVGQEKASPLYEQAYKANKIIDSDKIDKILNTPSGKSAFRKGVELMQNQSKLVSVPDKELTQLAKDAADLGLDGAKGKVGRGLKLEVLDYTKRGFDSAIEKAKREGDRALVKVLSENRKDLVSEMDNIDATGLYSKARSKAADYLVAEKSMKSGADFLKANNAEQITRDFAKMNDGQKQAYKAGVVKTIRDKIDGATQAIGDPLLSKNIAKPFLNKSVEDKLRVILPENEFNKFKTELSAVDKLYQLRNQVSANSRTAMRKIAAEEFSGEGAEEALKALASGRGLTRTALDAVVKFASKKFTGLSDNAAKEVAEILFETDPVKKSKNSRRASKASFI